MERIEKAVITSAGKGTRMKYITSVLPKCLLPLLVKDGIDGKKVAKPVIDLIMKSVEEVGVSKFCVVVGKMQGRILMEYLFDRGPTFVFQNEAKGFGDAVLKAEDFADQSPFFVHADDGVLTSGYDVLSRAFLEKNADAALFVRQVKNPYRYGIIQFEESEVEDFMGHKLYHVNGVEEKPKEPKSNLAIAAVYIFRPSIFSALKEVKVNQDQELELTFGIKNMVEKGKKVIALSLDKEKWLNVGDPDSYFDSFTYAYKEL
ncbi:nucleotidyltransferase family protein [Sulfuracidifex tepidarius]|uniref:UTP--glucose-1-phosphate uridylyltransferase n=1 Tax=Sulfuracidifex tepidarius TaxID=1294262 RepID=A0A510E4U5_9CREN|nr:sugar phosphate nucleotidyltransferase [Sulfuracidifex tepidarius]BBG24742.1 UTP--glucose-1-phosphate uridylyltransferase AglF [Sulfuracidifex tepidarius]BBG27531.1 UTP--glucose-1-phosphate uridylyltransferase AglF [Sulfuracidifex tepidarius]